jgi:hypothetical protein
MRGASRASYTGLREHLTAAARGAVTAGRVGDELFAVVGLLDNEHGLRRMLADPAGRHLAARRGGQPLAQLGVGGSARAAH